jgi:4-hydroxy-2-oxoheptanedioate aldolase
VHAGSVHLKRKWSAGEAVFGPVVQLPAPGLVEIFALAGFDLVVVDLEHGPLNLETAENMIRAANASGIAAAVRVLANQPEHIAAALSLGADVVLVPHVTSEADAAAAVAAARFAPAGSRGVCPFVRAASYSATKDDGYYRDANDAVIVNVLLEGVDALANLDALLEMPGLDVISLAPFDLSQSLGVTGEIDHPLVVAAVEDACRRAEGHGKVVCFVVEEPSAARPWLELGVKWITATVDTQMIYAAARNFATELNRQMNQLRTTAAPGRE